MANLPSRAQWVAPAALGILAGVASSVGMSRCGENSDGVAPVASPPGPIRTVVVREVRQVSVSSPDAQAESSPSADESSARLHEPDAVERSRERAHERHRGLLQDHRASVRDPSWAREAASSLEDDLEQLAELSASSFTVVDVDCRSASCVVRLEWSNFDVAVAEWAAVLHHKFELNCEREALLPEPSEEERHHPYRTEFVFTCE